MFTFPSIFTVYLVVLDNWVIKTLPVVITICPQWGLIFYSSVQWDIHHKLVRMLLLGPCLGEFRQGIFLFHLCPTPPPPQNIIGTLSKKKEYPALQILLWYFFLGDLVICNIKALYTFKMNTLKAEACYLVSSKIEVPGFQSIDLFS